MNVAIVGYGIEGRSALTYYQAQGADVTVCDKNEHTDIPDGVDSQLGEDYLKDLYRFDVIVRTVGMHPRVILAENPGVEDKLTTTVNEFLRVFPTKNVIGVTGTKGKGTTSMLIVKMLEAAGKKVFMGGNYGIPALDFLPEVTENDWVVMELSSFMLYDIKHSPHISVCLMVSPEHIDWHGDTEDYYRSKSHIFSYQQPDDIAIYYAENENSKQIANSGSGQKIPFYQPPGACVQDGNIVIGDSVLCSTTELQLLGTHNWQNVCGAVTAVWQITQDAEAIRAVLTSFSGLPNRLELVRELNGVRYYNDSFSSDPYAAEAAIQAVPGKKVLICGGYDRMIPLEGFAKTVKDAENDIRTIVAIGASGKRLGEALENAGFSNYHISEAKTMHEIVAEAQSYAQVGDSMVLSPGFASFDMFKNFDDRGEQFRSVVNAL
jgi:UDP-N-acetylmuramoylalanine--D-glutamate ligase